MESRYRDDTETSETTKLKDNRLLRATNRHQMRDDTHDATLQCHATMPHHARVRGEENSGESTLHDMGYRDDIETSETTHDATLQSSRDDSGGR